MINEYNDYNTSLSLLQGLQLSSVKSMGLLSSSVVLYATTIEAQIQV